ncbi:unnamed protein product [Notodromas monacha]|uniref:Uncharacterized protein n=1 Tax=Notodromas monacha TaxID=399045 RepID=A0A7R9BVX4_9CRUS|nr:unnamed protein product [Notodromas monacha]CAG0921755.1 unnamed protein product [Notodromas monacha]
MSGLSFNPKKMFRGIFRRHRSEKMAENHEKSLAPGNGLKSAKSCPFVHVQGDEMSGTEFQSRLSLWMDPRSGTPGSVMENEITVRSPHHFQRLSADLLLICQSRCDNPVVRDLLNDDSWETDELSPTSALSPRPASLAVSPRSMDVSSVRSHEEAILGSEAIHPYLIRSPPPVLVRGPPCGNVFVFPDNNQKKSARCFSEASFSPPEKRTEDMSRNVDDLQSLPVTPKMKNISKRNWIGRSTPDMSHILTASKGSECF